MVLRQYTNRLLQKLITEGHNVNDFKLIRRQGGPGGEYVAITYKDSSFAFNIFQNGKETFDSFQISYTRFLPDYPTIQPSNLMSIDSVEAFLLKWIREDIFKYIENIHGPDLWTEIQENPITIDGINFNDTSPFKPEEINQLKVGLEEIKILLKTNFELNEGQIEIANKRIDYLAEALNRLTKADWRGIAISTVIGLSIELTLDEQKRTTLFGLLSKIWAMMKSLPPFLV